MHYALETEFKTPAALISWVCLGLLAATRWGPKGRICTLACAATYFDLYPGIYPWQLCQTPRKETLQRINSKPQYLLQSIQSNKQQLEYNPKHTSNIITNQVRRKPQPPVLSSQRGEVKITSDILGGACERFQNRTNRGTR